MYHEVNKLANAMKSLGVGKGDRVGIYMPMLVELPIAMLACAKIGAIHSVVFSGFSPTAFAERLNDCEAKLAITCDHFWRRGKKVALKDQTDAAMELAPTVENVIVYKRTGDPVSWTEGRDHWWHEIAADQSDECETEQLDANDLLYILYTSGTTGQPEGHPARPRRLRARHGDDPQVGLRPSRRTTSGGARPTSAGSPVTATSSTLR